ncbi:MAG TPA: exopolysaccharide biosynthesis polyprenyl glycosylphosphotransferase [Armatimonadota bacterium]|nr:exopolysaccharide biosynthesis polyprenyl glycosylphosphotransferase [Armatimonadota bacterium]
MPSVKYCLTISAIGLAAWIMIAVREPVSVGLAGMLVGVVMAAAVAGRELPLHRRAQSATGEWAETQARPVRALIVGSGAVGRALARSLTANNRYHVVGFVDDAMDFEHEGEWKVLGGRDETAALVRQHDVEEVFLAYAPTWQQRLAEELIVRHPSVRVRVVPSPYEALMQMGSVESHGDIALVRLIQGTGRARDLIKRAFDVTVALSFLLVLSPLMLLVTVLIKATSAGPAVFTQERVGRYGVPFLVHKFRTMVVDAEAKTGPVLSSGKDDPRLTPIGKWLKLFRIDELPQLWNVLRGEMSMVGPRPERPAFVREFESHTPTYAMRHRVRPGITGLAQVCGGYHTDARDKLRFDLIYVSHQSLWLDLSVLLRTVMVVCRPSR